MKITQIEREVCHKINVGGYETIQPMIRLAATLDEGDDIEEARKELSNLVEQMFLKEAVAEVRLVRKRRSAQPVDDDKSFEVMDGLKHAMT